MLPITCTHCHRNYFSAARPRGGQRCPACRGPLEVSERDTGAPAAIPLELPPLARAEEGSFEETEGSYRSLIDFSDADPRRGPSPERDLGLQWRDAQDRVFRAAWASDTHELILIQLGPEEGGGGHVQVLAVADERLVIGALDGWETVCGLPGSAEWLLHRVALLPGSAQPVGAPA